MKKWMVLWMVAGVLSLVLIACDGGGGGPVATPPAAPSNVTAAPGPGYITVGWQDNADNETGFVIYREPAAASSVSGQAFTEIASVSANTTTYQDNGVTAGASYRYQVAARNAAGASSPANHAGPAVTPAEPGGAKADYNTFSAGLPTWSEFSPLEEPENAQAGDPTTFEDIIGDVTYDCTSTPYSLTQNPDEIVTFDPDSNILWVGALLQGDGYKDGIGSLRELPVRERAPLVLSIDVLSDNNTRTVENPTLATVQQAIGELIQAATNAGVKAGSSVSFSQKETYSVEQAALELGLSARYMGFSVKSNLEASRSANERTVTAYFVQKMFTVSMVLPQTPEAVFSDAFTQDVLDKQIALGNINPTNIPTYVANIVYGRILSFSFTSTAEESDIKAALSASYNGIGGGGSADLSAEQKQILQQAEIGVVTVGGEGKDALAIIRSGDLRQYFQQDAALTSAKPISYTVRNLGDNSIAKVSETTDYSLRECTARAKEAKKIGEEVRITLERVVVHDACDSGFTGSNGEVYGTMDINGSEVWRLGERDTSDGESITINRSQTKSYLLGTTDTIRISGFLNDDDNGNDDKIGVWNLSLPPFSSYGNKSSYSNPDCDSTLYYRIEKVQDLFE